MLETKMRSTMRMVKENLDQKKSIFANTYNICIK